MAKLVNGRGEPLSSSDFATPRGRGRPPRPRPKVGETNVAWGGDGLPQIMFKDGGRMLLDPSKLTLADRRRMKNHYQINSSLTVLTFMMHQLDWSIEGSNQRVISGVEYAIDKVWTRLVRAMSTAFWAGYSPSALQWENDTRQNMLVINKIKDLVPEYCDVAWKEVGAVKLGGEAGATSPKTRVYDGIKQYVGGYGSSNHIPQSNSYWYPLLMENGDMFGKKLLDSAFAPWFFSNMIHAYANSYYERFGEPTPIARAPYGEKVDLPDGTAMDSADFMAQSMGLLRSGAAIILPNDKESKFGQTSNSGADYEFTVEYLESQMRGADFEQHLQRLDEEMSLALFTPLLLLRTTQGSGYNVGVGHQQVYLWQLNALAADWKEYIDKYIVQPIVTYNYGARDWARIKFRKMGVTQQETTRAVVQELLRSGRVNVDVEELGHAIGMTLEEVEQVQEPAPGGEPEGEPQIDDRIGRPERLRDDDQPSVDKPKTERDGVSLSAVIQEVRSHALSTLEHGEPEVIVPAGMIKMMGEDRVRHMREVLNAGLGEYGNDTVGAGRFFDAVAGSVLGA